MPFELILRSCEVIFWCLECQYCTFWKIDGNPFSIHQNYTMALKVADTRLRCLWCTGNDSRCRLEEIQVWHLTLPCPRRGHSSQARSHRSDSPWPQSLPWWSESDACLQPLTHRTKPARKGDTCIGSNYKVQWETLYSFTVYKYSRHYSNTSTQILNTPVR